MTEGDPAHHRTVRSFVLREGRFTDGQQRAFARLWSRYGRDFSPTLDPAELFPDRRPVRLEIGCGNGEALLHMAAAHPDLGFIGVEVHRPGVGRLLLGLERGGLENVRVLRHDAVEVLAALPDACLDGIYVFFPDPWPKTRHHKRRLVQPAFAAAAARVLAPGGFLHLATDWEDYSCRMLEVLGACPDLVNTAPDGAFVERPADRPLTHFEQRGRRLGHGVWDLVFRRRGGP